MARFLEEGAKVCAVDISEEKLDAFDVHKNLFTPVADISKEKVSLNYPLI